MIKVEEVQKRKDKQIRQETRSTVQERVYRTTHRPTSKNPHSVIFVRTLTRSCLEDLTTRSDVLVTQLRES